MVKMKDDDSSTPSLQQPNPPHSSVDPSNLKASTDESKDVAYAILKKKASPNKLIVDDALGGAGADDNSVCTLSTATMEVLGLFRGYALVDYCPYSYGP